MLVAIETKNSTYAAFRLQLSAPFLGLIDYHPVAQNAQHGISCAKGTVIERISDRLSVVCAVDMMMIITTTTFPRI